MAKVLLIESDAGLAQSVCEALAGRGVDAECVGDGFDGVDVARRIRPDAIVLCVELTRVSGYSVCNKLRKDPELSRIPLVLTSSQATNETFDQHSKLRTRADAYLKKPYEIGELLAALRVVPGLGSSPVVLPESPPAPQASSGFAEAKTEALEAPLGAYAEAAVGELPQVPVLVPPPLDVEQLLTQNRELRSRVEELEARIRQVDAQHVEALAKAHADVAALTDELSAMMSEGAALRVRCDALQGDAGALQRRLEAANNLQEKARRALDAAVQLVSASSRP